MVRERWLGSPKIGGSEKHNLNSEAIGKVWILVVSRPTPHSGLSIQYITGGSFNCLCQNLKTRPEPGCSEMGERLGWGHHFNKDAVSRSYKFVSKLCGCHLKGQGNESRIQGYSIVFQQLCPFCEEGYSWSYHQVVISPVITFTVHDTSKHCKDVQVVTEILADRRMEDRR